MSGNNKRVGTTPLQQQWPIVGLQQRPRGTAGDSLNMSPGRRIVFRGRRDGSIIIVMRFVITRIHRSVPPQVQTQKNFPPATEEDTTCACGAVPEDTEHVLLHCPLTHDQRL
jgi:hypothetical protein